MRTTVNIEDQLLVEAKTMAARSGRTLGAVIEDALRVALLRRDAPGSAGGVHLPVHDAGGLMPGVDLDDSAALLDLIEDRSR